ncbi:MAG: phosphate signaling complex protein PhoU [Calditrichaeota bacterium]|nr:phosphate signaling complex protein PhoU [Calditrichota bacterium]
MEVHLQREIAHLKNKILLMGGRVEAALAQAVKALNKSDTELAAQVINDDRAIDLFEVEIEEDCLKILALYQPVAIDLRFVIGVIKINNDLERIADLAVNIAERAQSLASTPRVILPDKLNIMSEKVQAMLKDSIDALVNCNENLARDILGRDDEIDRLHQDMFKIFEDNLAELPQNIDRCINLLSVSRYLERAADQATNIAEDVVYMVTGQIIRHN